MSDTTIQDPAVAKLDGPVVTSRQELDTTMKRMSALRTKIQRHQTQRDEEVRALDNRYGKVIVPAQEEYAALEEACVAFARQSQEALLAGQKTKTLKLPYGSVAFKDGSLALALAEAEDVIIGRLKRQGLADYIRTKEELNRQGLLANTKVVDRIKGLSIVRGQTVVTIKLNAAQ